jgi:NADH:ubiquinone oxidoreductase subunit 2 (subunit N)
MIAASAVERIIAAVSPAGTMLACAVAALGAGILLLGLERRAGLLPALALGTLAAAIATPVFGGLHSAPIVVALVVATLARHPDELLHGECALKLMWVMGSALALSWAGLELLTMATGTSAPLEQWAVLGLGLEPRFLWNTALPLSLLVGLVLLGGAPFHFWVADVFQGVRPWLAPIAVAALQVTGAAWLSARLDGIERFRPGAELASGLLRIAAFAALAAGAATLLVQRRPERRIGTLASLNGALGLAVIASRHELAALGLERWAAHGVLALTGASTLARFLPVSSPTPVPGAPLLRRHPLAAAAGLYAFGSLAGVPGTPGCLLWLDAARVTAIGGPPSLLLILIAAWLAALTVAVRQLREALGVPASGPRPSAVPLRARLALVTAGGMLLVLLAGAGL